MYVNLLSQEAECEKARMEVRYKVDEAIAEHQREFELQKAAFDVEINQARAEADLAEELQASNPIRCPSYC